MLQDLDSSGFIPLLKWINKLAATEIFDARAKTLNEWVKLLIAGHKTNSSVTTSRWRVHPPSLRSIESNATKNYQPSVGKWNYELGRFAARVISTCWILYKMRFFLLFQTHPETTTPPHTRNNSRVPTPVWFLWWSYNAAAAAAAAHTAGYVLHRQLTSTSSTVGFVSSMP